MNPSSQTIETSHLQASFYALADAPELPCSFWCRLISLCTKRRGDNAKHSSATLQKVATSMQPIVCLQRQYSGMQMAPQDPPEAG